jgi:PKD repeat protein
VSGWLKASNVRSFGFRIVEHDSFGNEVIGHWRVGPAEAAGDGATFDWTHYEWSWTTQPSTAYLWFGIVMRPQMGETEVRQFWVDNIVLAENDWYGCNWTVTSLANVVEAVAYDPDGNSSSFERRITPVAHWRFDEGSGTTAFDSSGNGNDGELKPAYSDDFEDGVIASEWSFRGLSSYAETGGALVLEANSYTWGNLDTGAHVAFSAQGDFVVEAEVEWVARSDDLAQIVINVKGATGSIAGLGMVDAWRANTGYRYAWAEGGESYRSGMGTLPASGSATLRIVRNGGTYEFYWDGELILTGSGISEVVEIVLTNTRYESYNGKTAKWNWVRAVGSPSWVDGVSENALSFDGVDDYVGISALSPVQDKAINAFTFGAWVNYTSDTGTVQQVFEGHTNTWEIYLEGDFPTLNFMISDDEDQNHQVSATVGSLNTWYHVVGTYNGTTQKLYVNGEEVDSVSWSSTFTITTGITLGKDHEADIQYFNGIIDDVRIYNRALSAKEIELLSRVPPIAEFSYSPPMPWAGQQVTFDASESYDPGGSIVRYEWDFGDGESGELGEVVQHQFWVPGTYTVKLTVTDDDGATDTYSEVIMVTDNLPTVTTQSASSVGKYSATLNMKYDFKAYGPGRLQFVYWKQSDPGSTYSTGWEAASGSGSYSKSISGLSSGTTYEFKAQLEDVDGTVYEGGIKEFKTSSGGGGGGGGPWFFKCVRLI